MQIPVQMNINLPCLEYETFLYSQKKFQLAVLALTWLRVGKGLESNLISRMLLANCIFSILYEVVITYDLDC